MDPKPHILVVDDEPRAVELLVRSLRKLGRVATAASAADAIALARRESFDLVVSDQRMPGTNGVELLTEIATLDDSIGRVLLTGYTDLDTCVEAINHGRVHAYLHKPCAPPDLLSTVTGVLQRVGIARENTRLLSVVTEQNHQLEETLASLRSAQERVLASERLAAVGRMIAVIVHDLRSPIATIRSASGEMTRSTEASADLKELALDVATESERLQQMCNELLEVSRASERAPCSVQPLDDVVDDCVASLQGEASERDAEIVVELGSDAGASVDPSNLRRAISNLVRNSMDAMPEGGVIRVATRREGSWAVVAVSDSGPGVPSEIADRVFEPFVTFGKPSGCGLGLAVVRKIAEDFGGEVSLAKSDGGGAQFQIRLPVAA